MAKRRTGDRQSADSLIAEAQRVATDKSTPKNQRLHTYCSLMLQWATAKIVEEPERAVSFSREAAEWAKREAVALKAVAQDEYQAILRAVESRRADGEALARMS